MSLMDIKKGVSLGLGLLILTAVLTGLSFCQEGEVLIISNIPTMSSRSVICDTSPSIRTPFGGIYWHLPWPIEMAHKVNFASSQYEVATPILFSVAPNYFLVLTEEGFFYAHAYELSDLEVMILHVDGEYQITNLTAWAEIDIFGRGEDIIESYISSAIDRYIEFKITEIYEDLREDNSERSVQELMNILSQKIADDPTVLLDGFDTYEIKVTVEEVSGIKLLRFGQVRILEEPLSEYI